MRKVLVLGGTGFVGRSVCAKLTAGADNGYHVTVATRRLPAASGASAASSAPGATTSPGIDLVQADVHRPDVLARLLEGQDAVINLVAILHGSDAAFRHVHVELPRALVAACRSAGVRRIVHVSALGVDAAAPSRYLRSKAEGEALILNAGLDASVLRPSVIYGEHDRFLNLFAKLQKFAPVLPLAGAEARFQPVWVENVAAAVVACLDQPATIGQVFECAGPQIFTLAELVRLAGRWSGHERPVIPLPAVVGRLQAAAMEVLPGETLMSRDNLDSMRVPNVASGRLPSLDALGIRAAAMASVAPTYLAAAR